MRFLVSTTLVVALLLVFALWAAAMPVAAAAWSRCTVNAVGGGITGGCVPTSLFDSESISPVAFDLHTAVVSDLTVTFSEPTGRIVMTPSVIVLAAGATSFAADLQANFSTSDINDNISLTLEVTMSGTNAGTYAGETFPVVLRPKIDCRITTPAEIFYVNTTSLSFNLTCDNATDSQVQFQLPDYSANGITFSPAAVTLNAGDTLGTFTVTSADPTQNGSYSLGVVATGDNATRYRAVPPRSLRVRPLGRITFPPTFVFVAYRASELFHVDLTIIPARAMSVNISAFRASDDSDASADIEIRPSNQIVYGPGSVRGNFTLYGSSVGKYYLKFSVNGSEAGNFDVPLIDAKKTPFEIVSPRDGFAFTKRTTLGYLPRLRECRVGVGRLSYFFHGQEPVDGDTCAKLPQPNLTANESTNCSQWTTPERCQGVVEEKGHPCAWLKFPSPMCVDVPELRNELWQVAFGSQSTTFLDRNGSVWTIGSPLYGQLGRGDNSTENVLGQVTAIPEGIKVIAAGANHVMALAGSGTLYMWGSNTEGQIGLNTNVQSYAVPTVIPNDGSTGLVRGENITCISAGPQHSAAVTYAGRAYAWGINHRGQLGHKSVDNTTLRALLPVMIPAAELNSDPAIAVHCGETHTQVATAFSAYTFGANTMGQLGRKGFDEWKPLAPTLWAQAFGTPPTYPSALLGKDCTP